MRHRVGKEKEKKERGKEKKVRKKRTEGSENDARGLAPKNPPPFVSPSLNDFPEKRHVRVHSPSDHYLSREGRKEREGKQEGEGKKKGEEGVRVCTNPCEIPVPATPTRHSGSKPTEASRHVHPEIPSFTKG